MSERVDNAVRDLQDLSELYRKVMEDGVHYGTIPGFDRRNNEEPRKVLLLPGAQLIAKTFDYCPSYSVVPTSLDGGHIAYDIVCRLVDKGGNVVAEGVGTCSTMESKYRYIWIDTDEKAPDDYKDRKGYYKQRGFRFRKSGNQWVWQQRVDTPNPRDHANTAMKIAKKRAFVDAVITATSSAGMFTQDLEDITDNMKALGAEQEPAPEPESKPAARKPAPPRPLNDTPRGVYDIMKVEVYEGESKTGKSWKRWGIITQTSDGQVGVTFGTFNEEHANTAIRLVNKNKRALIFYEEKERGGRVLYDVVDIQEAAIDG